MLPTIFPPLVSAINEPEMAFLLTLRSPLQHCHAQAPRFYEGDLPPVPPGLEWWEYRDSVPLLPVSVLH